MAGQEGKRMIEEHQLLTTKKSNPARDVLDHDEEDDAFFGNDDDGDDEVELRLPGMIGPRSRFTTQRKRLAWCLVIFWVCLVILVAILGRKDDQQAEDVDETSNVEHKPGENMDDDIVHTVDEGGDDAITTPGTAKKQIVMDDSKFLQNLSCIPTTCFERKHFVNHPSHLADPHGFTLLASFPGAGNTWTRAIIEEGTRVYTGSMYPTDQMLLRDGFKGEEIDSFAGVSPTVSAIKTHYPLFEYPIPSKVRYAIQVLRSPFDALLSEFNREHGKGGDPHTNVATVETFRTVFPGWFHKRAMRYYGHAKFWDGPGLLDNALVDRSKGVTSVELQRNMFGGKKNHTIPVLVVFYEDLSHNFVETTRRVFSFMRSKTLGKAMPSVETSLICAIVNLSSETDNKRTHSKKQYNPYTDPQGGIAKKGMVKKFCDAIKEYWFDEKWGDCYSGQIQSNRDAVIVKPPRLTTKKCA